ncbi:DUF4249 family protein, partial [Campylobacter fetus subsp. venerealis]
MEDVNFSAKAGIAYKVRIETSEGKIYESDEDSIHPAPAIEKVDVEHKTILKSISVDNQIQLVEQRGVQISVPLKEHSEEIFHFRWKIVPSWIFETSMLGDENPNKRCYVT